MVEFSADEQEALSYADRLERIESLITEANAYVHSDSSRLQFIATQIDTYSTPIDYRRGTAYAQLYTAQALYLQTKFEEALPCYATALEIFTEKQEINGRCQALRYMGLSHHLLCRYEWALEYYRQELELREQFFAPDIIGLAGTLTNIATMHLMMGRYDIALQHYLRSLDIMQEHRDNHVYLATMSNIANVYMAIEQYAKALEVQNNVLAIYRQKENEVGEANTLLNMGWTYTHCTEYKQALECNRRALELFEAQKNRKKAAIAQLYIGQTCLHLKRYEEALHYLEKGYNISYEIGDRKNCTEILRTRGDIMTAQQQYLQAKEYYLSALEITQEIGIRQTEYELYELLAQTEERTGNAIVALQYYRDFIRVKAEVMDESRQKTINELQMRFDVEQIRREKEIYQLKNVDLARTLEKVEQLNSELMEISNEKNEMMGIVAHDLKNPIAGLSMSLSMLRRYLTQMSPQDIIHQIDMMETGVQRMNEIVTKLLDANVLESGVIPFNFSSFDLNMLIQSVLEDYRIRMDKKNITAQCILAPEAPIVYADKGAILQVLDNLVSNAIKYSFLHTSITLCSSVVGTMARFEISDSGPGIAVVDQDKLFKKFVRLHTQPTGGESSTGLGLSIVKKLVDSMNGRIWCESTSGEGATFILELPIAI